MIHKKLYSKFKRVDWADESSFTIDGYHETAFRWDTK